MEENTNEVGTQVVEEQQEAKTYSQEEVDKLLQSETDRRVTMALQKQERKNAEKVKEAEKLAKMNEQDKYEYELEQRERAIQEKERELALSENKNQASKILSEKGISLELVDFVVADDADTMDRNIKLLDRAFKASVKAEVEKRLGSKVPQQKVINEDTLTRDQFIKMSLSEQQQLYNTNPELYKSLINLK